MHNIILYRFAPMHLVLVGATRDFMYVCACVCERCALTDATKQNCTLTLMVTYTHANARACISIANVHHLKNIHILYSTTHATHTNTADRSSVCVCMYVCSYDACLIL